MGISPEVWGACAWVFLHTAGREYDRRKRQGEAADTQAYQRLLILMARILPCAACSTNFAAYTEKHPWTPASSLGQWMFDAHAAKRVEQQKTTFKTFEEFQGVFEEKMCGNNRDSPYYGDPPTSPPSPSCHVSPTLLINAHGGWMISLLYIFVLTVFFTLVRRFVI